MHEQQVINLSVTVSQLLACITVSQHVCWRDYCDDEQQCLFHAPM